jgi:hypothetical protein
LFILATVPQSWPPLAFFHEDLVATENTVTAAPFLVDSQLRVVADEADDGNAVLIHTLLLRE